MIFSKSKSPYLESGRLADIVAAIPVLGAFEKRTSQSIEYWQKKLGEPGSCRCWKNVFEAHPEFFRINTDESKYLVSLRWRWALDKDYDPDSGASLSALDIEKLGTEQKKKLTMMPLAPEQIEVLINTAVKLHESAIELERHSRWWVQLVIPAVTTIVGVLMGAWLKS